MTHEQLDRTAGVIVIFAEAVTKVLETENNSGFIFPFL